MPYDFYPGRKVICLRDGWDRSAGEYVPRAGGVYTIRDVEPGSREPDKLYLRFYEVVNSPRRYRDVGFRECNFDAREFRPIDERETDISDLERLLEPKAVPVAQGMSEWTDTRDDICPYCRGIREACLNRKTGAAYVTLPRRCEHREKCEQEIHPGFEPDSTHG